jgi:ubiquinone/menaquinone biosynthesis C-methylase UbiE
METVYRGKTATQYDKKRRGRRKWKREMRIIQDVVKEFNSETTILDVPFGTGRFLPIYKKFNHRTLGIDVSADMLKIAKTRTTPVSKCPLVIGDAVNLPLRSKTFDYVVCIRLLNWVTTPKLKEIIQEFHRVAKKGILIGFRSQRRGDLKEMIIHFFLDLRLILRHVHRLMRWLLGLGKRIKGKISRTFRTKGGEILGDSPHQVREVKTFHESAELMDKISELKMHIQNRFYVDTVVRYKQKKICPYHIFWLKIND